MALSPGTKLGPYEVLTPIGAGGMGEVYRAKDTRLDRTVAIKVLPSHLSADPEHKQRFEREARTVSSLNHPHICMLYDIGHQEGIDFLVMEYVEGESLAQHLEKGALTIDLVLRYAIQIAEALAKAHGQGIIHRDLKPGNIMLTQSGTKLLDFGLAKHQKSASQSEMRTAGPSLTEEGVVLGTVQYMSPEQVRGEEVDARSDIFSFGITLFEMMTGELPFHGKSRMDTLAAILNQAAEIPSRLNPKIPAELDRIIAKCLEKDREARFQHTDELVVDLQRLKETILSPSGAGNKSSGARPVQRKRIVVLPFENLGPSEEEYFALGIAEEIMSSLAGINGLGVISRTTAMAYNKSGKSIRQIGEDLGVEFVLEGTVRWAGASGGANRVRITPQLIRVSDDTHLWANRYDRVMDDVFQVQSDIAEHVSEQLGLTLLDPERKELHATPTRNFEAYQAYLRGLYYERPRGFLEERDRMAVKMFQQAVDLDPGFALAHAELAITHSALYHYGFDHSQERLMMAARAVEHAKRLAPDSPRVHLATGYYYYWCLREYERAFKEFTIAERGLPGNSEVVVAMGFVRRRQGKIDEALRHLEKAAELNPMDTHFAIQVGDTLVMVGRYAEAEAQYDLSIRFLPNQIAAYVAKAALRWTSNGDIAGARAALEAMPEESRRSSFGFIHWFWQEIFEGKYARALDRVSGISDDVVNPATKNLLSAQAHSFLGETERAHADYDAARIVLENESRNQPANYWIHASLGIVYAGLGIKEDAIREGRKATDLCPVSTDAFDGGAFHKNLALILTMVGEYDAAIEQIKHALESPGSAVEYLPLFPSGVTFPLLRLDPRWKCLWDHPPFQQLARTHNSP